MGSWGWLSNGMGDGWHQDPVTFPWKGGAFTSATIRKRDILQLRRLEKRASRLAYKFFWKQLEQLAKTTSFFSPRNRAAFLEAGRGCARKNKKLFLSVVMVVSF